MGSFVAIDGRTQEAHGTCRVSKKGSCPHPSSPVPWTAGPNAQLGSDPALLHTWYFPHQLCTVRRALSALCWPESESTSEGGSAVPSHLEASYPDSLPRGMETEPIGAIASLPCLGPGITDAQRKAEGTMRPARWQIHPPVWGGLWPAEGRCCLY